MSVSTKPAQCAAASPKMGLKPAPDCGTKNRGLELCLVAKEERGKPSLRLVTATGADGRCKVGESLVLHPQRGQGPWWGEDTAAACAQWGGKQCGEGELDVVERSQGLTLLAAGGPEQSLGAEHLCIPSLRQSLAMHSQSQRALGSVLGLLRCIFSICEHFCNDHSLSLLFLYDFFWWGIFLSEINSLNQTVPWIVFCSSFCFPLSGAMLWLLGCGRAPCPLFTALQAPSSPLHPVLHWDELGHLASSRIDPFSLQLPHICAVLALFPLTWDAGLRANPLYFSRLASCLCLGSWRTDTFSSILEAWQGPSKSSWELGHFCLGSASPKKG